MSFLLIYQHTANNLFYFSHIGMKTSSLAYLAYLFLAFGRMCVLFSALKKHSQEYANEIMN